tara:strand:+ start:862 stop:1137 length:276 start_codon:yes stop_codon:yes gene_type:complete
MAVIGSGVNPKNDSSQNLKNKRKAIIEEERIRQLEKSLFAFYEIIQKDYDIIKSVDMTDNIDGQYSNVEKVSIDDIKSLIKRYAKTKPIGF